MPKEFEVFPSLLPIMKPFKGILLDAYGVFWGGNSIGPLPGAKEIMEQMVKQGKIVGILSNTTQLAAKEIEKIAKQGLIEGKHFHFLTTSGEIAKRFLREEKFPFETPQQRFWVLGDIHPRFSSYHEIFNEGPYIETKDISEADFIYISVPHIDGEDQVDPDRFREGIEKLKHTKLPMICINPDRFSHEGNPPQAFVRQGSIAAIYEEIGGEVFYMGKPSSLVYKAALERFSKHGSLSLGEILMVGDTPETDIRGAHRFGIRSALVTKTGIMADRIAKSSLKEVVEGLLPSDRPDFYIERLGAL